MKNKAINFLKNVGIPILGLFLFVSIWALIARIIKFELILPTPKATILSFYNLLSKDFFWVAVGKTLTKSLISYLISLFLALLLAILNYSIPILHKGFFPIITILRAVPTMSIILILLIWFNTTIAPMIISGLIVFPILYSSFHSFLEQVPNDLIEMSKYYNVPMHRQICYLYIPSITIPGLSAIQSSISLNLKVLIAAEVLASTKDSIGRYMQVSKIYLDTVELLAWTIMAILLGAALELMIKGVKILVMKRWHQ